MGTVVALLLMFRPGDLLVEREGGGEALKASIKGAFNAQTPIL